MKTHEIKVCIMRIEGTNCEDETKRAFDKLGVNAEIVNLKQLYSKEISKERQRNLSDYQVLIFPGGFSAGDYVRAGAIWASLLKSKLNKEMEEFVKDGKVIGGICNGFQVITQLGYLPGTIEAALGTNNSAKFECRFVYLKNYRKCAFTESLQKDQIVCFPIGHAEGRFTLSVGKEEKEFAELENNDQIVFKYVTQDGVTANGKYPENPNGSYADIAGVCNLEGNIFGMMPHPERVLDRVNHFDWTQRKQDLGVEGDGLNIFKSILQYVNKNL